MRRAAVPVAALALVLASSGMSGAVVDRADVAATMTVRSDERVRVVITSDGRRVLVRYRVSGDAHQLRRTLHDGRATALLPAGSRRVAVKAQATRRLGASPWVRAVTAAPSGPADPAPAPSAWGDGSAAVTDAQLERAANTPVLFGHQSVGGNILDGMLGLYAERGVAQPHVLEWPSTHPDGGFLTHAYIGENGDPIGKIADFAEHVRTTPGLDVAVMKLCFVDIVDGTDVTAVFHRYRDTMAALEAQHPDVTLLYTTVPLTVGTSGDNATRQRLNALIRQQFGATGRLFDIAALESTRPDGSRVTGNGGTQLMLHPDYASDDGHLNDRGAKRVAAGFARLIASAP